MKEYAPTEAILLDIDGTLLDSNDAHAQAWVEALRDAGHAIGFERVRPLIGMGGDQLLEALLHWRAGDPRAEALDDARKALFLQRHLPTLHPTPGARELVRRLQAQEIRVVVATSASGEELERLLQQAQVADLVDACTTSDDAARSKPDPGIVRAALARAGVDPVEAILIGDTPYDIAAAAAAGVDTIALRCGGWWDDAALAQAVALYDSPADLCARWDDSPVARRRIPGG